MNRIEKAVAALATLAVVLSCSVATATTNVCGYKWGDWQRVDGLEGTGTNALHMAMAARSGKLGIVYETVAPSGQWTFYPFYTEYGYASQGPLTMTVTNEKMGMVGDWMCVPHGMQFDSSGTAQIQVWPNYNPDNEGIFNRTAPGTYTRVDSAAADIDIDGDYVLGQGHNAFVMDAADTKHEVWIAGPPSALRLEYGKKYVGGQWTNNTVLVPNVTDPNTWWRSPCLALDQNGYPHVSFTGTNTDVFHAWIDIGGTHVEKVGHTGMGIPSPKSVIAIDTNNHPMVGWLAGDDANLVVAMYNGSSWATNVIVHRSTSYDFAFYGNGEVMDLKLDKNGNPALVVAYADWYGQANGSTWVDYYTWNGSTWTGGNIGTFTNSAAVILQTVALTFDENGRPFVGLTFQPAGSSVRGVYLLTTVQPPSEYKWGDWQRVDSFEGTSTNALHMAMAARNGKLGIVYDTTVGYVTWTFFSTYTEYAYANQGALRMTVANENMGWGGLYSCVSHGMQFDSNGTAQIEISPFYNTWGGQGIFNRTAPGTYTRVDSEAADINIDGDGYLGQGHNAFVMDAADTKHEVWIAGPYTALQLEYGKKYVGGGWTNNTVLVPNVTDPNTFWRSPCLTLDKNGYPHVSYTGTNTDVFHAWMDAGGTHVEKVGTTGMGNPSPKSVIAIDTNNHPMVGWPACNDANLVVAMYNGSFWTTNVIVHRSTPRDFAFWGNGEVMDLKLDKNGKPALVVAYEDFNAGAAGTTWVDYCAWDGSFWNGYNIGTFTNSAAVTLQTVALTFDENGRPFVGLTCQAAGSSVRGVYLLTTAALSSPRGTVLQFR